MSMSRGLRPGAALRGHREALPAGNGARAVLSGRRARGDDPTCRAELRARRGPGIRRATVRDRRSGSPARARRGHGPVRRAGGADRFGAAHEGRANTWRRPCSKTCAPGWLAPFATSWRRGPARSKPSCDRPVPPGNPAGRVCFHLCREQERSGPSLRLPGDLHDASVGTSEGAASASGPGAPRVCGGAQQVALLALLEPVQRAARTSAVATLLVVVQSRRVVLAAVEDSDCGHLLHCHIERGPWHSAPTRPSSNLASGGCRPNRPCRIYWTQPRLQRRVLLRLFRSPGDRYSIGKEHLPEGHQARPAVEPASGAVQETRRLAFGH